MIPLCEAVDSTLEEQIQRKTGGRVRSLLVEQAHEQIVIHGTVESFHIKQLALVAVREAQPTARVRNAIVVDYPA